MTVSSPLLKGIPNIMLQRKKKWLWLTLVFYYIVCTQGGQRATCRRQSVPLPCGCWGSDSGRQVVSKHLYLLSRLAAPAMLLWGQSEAANLGGEHVAGAQWPKPSQYASPSKP